MRIATVMPKRSATDDPEDADVVAFESRLRREE